MGISYCSGTCSYRPPEAKDARSLSWRLAVSGGAAAAAAFPAACLPALSTRSGRRHQKECGGLVAASAGLRADYHNLPTVYDSPSRDSRFYFYRSLYTLRLDHFLAFLFVFSPAHYHFCTW